jgi:hypothetical protein
MIEKGGILGFETKELFITGERFLVMPQPCLGEPAQCCYLLKSKWKTKNLSLFTSNSKLLLNLGRNYLIYGEYHVLVHSVAGSG